MNSQYHSLNPTVITKSSNKSEKDEEFDAVAWDGFQTEQPDSAGGRGPQLHPVLSLSTSLLQFQSMRMRALMGYSVSFWQVLRVFIAVVHSEGK